MASSLMALDIALYNKYQIFIRPPGEEFGPEGNMPNYYVTEKPALSNIARELYSRIDRSRRVSPQMVGSAMLDYYFDIPMMHHGNEPTFTEVVAAVPQIDNDTVYLFIRPLRAIIGNHHISAIQGCIQVGVWIPEPGSDSSFHGQRFDQYADSCILPRMGCHFPQVPISESELMRRYSLVTAVKIPSCDELPRDPIQPRVEPLTVFRMLETELSNNIAYLWNEPGPKIGSLHTRQNSDIYNETGQVIAKHVVTWPTFHTWAYYGFFKPSLTEVLSQLPAEVFKPDRKLFVTTEMPMPYCGLNEMCIGDFHIGMSIIWEIVAPANDCASNSAAAAQAPAAVPPRDDYNEDRCMICLDAKPSTMVMPCGHVVVCAACSKGLAATHDAKICVKCRRPIEEVIYP